MLVSASCVASLFVVNQTVLRVRLGVQLIIIKASWRDAVACKTSGSVDFDLLASWANVRVHYYLQALPYRVTCLVQSSDFARNDARLRTQV